VAVVNQLACVALAAVFAVSAVAKLLDRDGTRQAVAGFGVPERLVPWVAAGLAPAELAVAALLVVPQSATVGLVLAVALLTAFSVAVIVALRSGRRPECHCFGRIGGADISGRTLVRNVGLGCLALAGLASNGDTDGSAAGWTLGLLTAAVVLAAEGLAGRAARRRRLTEDEAEFEAGESVVQPVAADFRLPTLAGGEVTLSGLLAPGRPLLLVTLSPGCGSCKLLRPDVGRWVQVLSAQLTVAVLAIGSREANLPAYQDMPQLPVLIDEDGAVRDQLGTSATPSAVLIGADGRPVGAVARGEQLIRRLLVGALTDDRVGAAPGGPAAAPAAPPAAGLGKAADELELTDVVVPATDVVRHLNGEATILLDMSTGATVLLDQIGALVWSILDGVSPLEEIVADLAEAFQAPVETVGPDVLELARALGQAGMLAGVSPAGGATSNQVPAATG
jgi:hypothetical protein